MSSLNEFTDCIDSYIMTLLKMHEKSINMAKIGLKPRFQSLTKQPGTNWFTPYWHKIQGLLNQSIFNLSTFTVFICSLQYFFNVHFHYHCSNFPKYTGTCWTNTFVLSVQNFGFCTFAAVERGNWMTRGFVNSSSMLHDLNSCYNYEPFNIH